MRKAAYWTASTTIAILFAFANEKVMGTTPVPAHSAAALSCDSRIFEVRHGLRDSLVFDERTGRGATFDVADISPACRLVIKAVTVDGLEPRLVGVAASRSFVLRVDTLELDSQLKQAIEHLGIPLADPAQHGWVARVPSEPRPAKPIGGGGDMVFVNAQPHPLFLATGTDAAAWIALRGFFDNGSYLARFSPQTGIFSIYPLFLADREAFVGSMAGLAIDSDQGAWVMSGDERLVVRVGPFGETESYKLPPQPSIADHISPTGQLTRDRHDRIWFVQSASGQVGYLERGTSARCALRIPGADQVVAAGSRVAVLNPKTERLIIIGGDVATTACPE